MEDGLPTLIARIESQPEIGAVSPKIRFAFTPQQRETLNNTFSLPVSQH